MKPSEALSPEEQKEALRLRLQAQRQRLVRQLTPPTPERDPEVYPRSMTMRFLTQKKGAQWIASAAAGLFGKKTFKTVSTAFVVSKAVSGLLSQQRSRRTRKAYQSIFREPLPNHENLPVRVTLEHPPQDAGDQS